MVGESVSVASRLSWWGALLLGVTLYLLIHIGLGGYLEAKLAAQESNRFYLLLEARYGVFIRATNWVGHGCLFVGIFFAVRNFFLGSMAGKTEKGIVGFICRLLGRGVD